MAFSEKFLKEVCASEKSNFYVDIFEDVKDILEECIEEIINERKLFLASDVKIYLQGAFLNGVWTGDETKLEVIVELAKTNEETFNELNYYTANIIKRRIVKIKPKYSLLDFKSDLFLKLTEKFPNQKLIKTNKTITIEKNRQNPITIEVLPAFSYKNINEKTNEEIPTILIYESLTNNYVLAFPKLHSLNMNEKDAKTDGNLKKVIRGFRRLRDILIEEDLIDYGSAPGYFIDCLIGNVPEPLLKGKNLSEIFTKILNYIKHVNMNDFMCLHEQFEMFNNGFDSWNSADARNFFNALLYAWENIKE